MSFANTTAHSEWSANSGKAYVATGPFQTAFYSYTASQNASLQTIGTLTLITNDATKCPSGRILALNGRKLTPGANPMNLITATPGSATLTTATPRLYLGVADLVSGVSGFIDPNSVLFAPYDKNRPVGDYLVDVSAGLTTTQALAQIHSGASANILTKSAGLLDASAGTAAASSSACGTVSMPSLSGNGVTVTATVTCTLVNATSIILLTPKLNTCVASVTTTGAGTFTISLYNIAAGIVAAPGVLVNFLVIN
jgi:hypothetical protein